MAYYLDTSALVKLVVLESESVALHNWMLNAAQPLVSSDLARTELLRAVRRVAPERIRQAREVLDALSLTSLPTRTFERAALFDPSIMRTLDALHLACAQELGDDLDGIVTYDNRLAEVTQTYGITTLAPR